MPIYGSVNGVNKKFSAHYGNVNGANKKFTNIYTAVDGVNKELLSGLVKYNKYTKDYTRKDVSEYDIFISRANSKKASVYSLSGVSSISSVPLLFSGDTPYYNVSGYSPSKEDYRSVPTSGYLIKQYGSTTIDSKLCSWHIMTYIGWRNTEDGDPFSYEIYGDGYSIEVTWKKGTLVGTVEAADGTYPNDGPHTDGYWYVKV